jgi:hypothetical protein
MFTKIAIITLALGFLAPAVANADILNKSALSKNKTLRSMITAKLNTMPTADTGRGTGKFTVSNVKGSYSTHVGVAGTSYSVNFTAQPTMKIKVNGKTQSVKLGGCFGACNTTQLPGGKYLGVNVTISGKLRSMAPGLN